jgi:RNA polymerase sigma factor (TIGR02999 family)
LWTEDWVIPDIEGGVKTSQPSEITQLLVQLSQGKREALDELVPIVYDQLRAVAHRHLVAERSGHTLNTTALVHETYLKLINVRQVQWRDRAHFFAMAGRLMRRVLIDYARAKKRDKRGGDLCAVSLDEEMGVLPNRVDDLLAVDDALARLEAESERQARVVECRCFAGLSVEETAAALGASEATVKRDWAFARAWLNRELGPESS